MARRRLSALQGGTYPAQVLYQEIADMACERIKAAITADHCQADGRSRRCWMRTIPIGSTRTSTSRPPRRRAGKPIRDKCHINWVVCDSDWEAEFCRVAEAHPRVRAYVKNQASALKCPIAWARHPRKYIPDFIVRR